MPKLILVSRLQSLFHSDALRVAKTLPEAPTLAKELSDFRANISQAGYASFGARSGKHDDLVLSLAIATWCLAGGHRAGSSCGWKRWASDLSAGLPRHYDT